MLSFSFVLKGEDQEVTGFELGYMFVVSDSATVSSEDAGSQGLMMVFLALVELLDGTNKLLSTKASRYEFVGPDSSFSLVFLKKKSKVEIQYLKKNIASVAADELAGAVYQSCREMWDRYGNNISASDPVFDDANEALSQYKFVFKL